MYRFRLTANFIYMILLLCTAFSYSNEVNIGCYRLIYAEPNDFLQVEHEQPNVLDVWRNPDSGDVIMIQVFALPSGLEIVESGVIEGLAETIGARIDNFKDFQSTHLLFREGTAEIPNLNAMVYLSYWWADGVCLKVQGMYSGDNENISMQTFRTFLSKINVSTEKKSTMERGKQTFKLDSHEISKKLGTIGCLIFLVLGIYIISKKQHQKAEKAKLEKNNQ